MTDHLFEMPEQPAQPAGPAPDYMACGTQGAVEAWVRPQRARPRCNRPAGHLGDHRRYSKTGKILASWASIRQVMRDHAAHKAANRV